MSLHCKFAAHVSPTSSCRVYLFSISLLSVLTTRPPFSSFQGYTLRISGGNDKQGFAMKQGVLSNGRVRLLLGANHSIYRARRVGQRHRRSVRGCIVGADLSVLNLVRQRTCRIFLAASSRSLRSTSPNITIDPFRSLYVLPIVGLRRLSSRRAPVRSPA